MSTKNTQPDPGEAIINRSDRPWPARAGLLLLVDAALRQAAATTGVLVPDLWLAGAPTVFIEVPSPDWLDPLYELLHKSGARVWICTEDEEGTNDPAEALRHQRAMNKSVWLAISGDRVSDLVRRSVDHAVKIENLPAPAIAKAVETLVGHALPGRSDDWTGLDLIMVARVLQTASDATGIVAALNDLARRSRSDREHQTRS